MYIGLYCEQEFLKEAVSTKANWPIKIPRLWRGVGLLQVWNPVTIYFGLSLALKELILACLW